MSTLYVTEPGSRIEKEYQRILVTKDNKINFDAPLTKISQVVLIGGCGISTPAILSLLDHHIGLTFLSSSGRIRGRLIPQTNKNNLLRYKQMQVCHDEKLRFQLSRSIVKGKIQNCRVMALRMRRSMIARKIINGRETQIIGKINRLKEIYTACDQTSTLERIRGFEGYAARLYFQILAANLSWGSETFDYRSRRPAKNPVNALLNLSYALLTNCICSAVEIADLDPTLGFFHTQKYGRPSLALDLMEEFRPVVADAIVLSVINKGIIQEKNFQTKNPQKGITLDDRSVKRFIRCFNSKIQSKTYHVQAHRQLTFQKIFEIQANQIKNIITEGKSDYHPFILH